jgi:hypothetical protein
MRPLLALAFAALSSVACSDGVPKLGAGPMLSCGPSRTGTEQTPSYVVGSSVPIDVRGLDGETTCELDRKFLLPGCSDAFTPTGVRITSSAPDVWRVDVAEDGRFKAVALRAGRATLSVTSAEVQTPAQLELVASELAAVDWIIGEGPATIPLRLLADGQGVNLRAELHATGGGGLCAVGIAPQLAGEGIGLEGPAVDRSGAIDFAGGFIPIRLQAPVAPSGNVTVTFGGASFSLPFRRHTLPEVSRLETRVEGNHVSASAFVGEPRVFGALFRAEVLEPVRAELGFNRREADFSDEGLDIYALWNGEAYLPGSGAIRVSLPGSSAAAIEAAYSFP